MKTTAVERKALSEILAVLGLKKSHLGLILERLDVDRREWSEDMADTEKCVGQFVYFSSAEELPVDLAVTHQGAWASHPESPGGVDFALFIKSSVPQFLEIGFFGFPMPKALMNGSAEKFEFRNRA